MEKSSNCFMCKKFNNDIFLFSCGHHACSLCASRTIFTQHLKELHDQDSVQIRCLCNHFGTLELNIFQVLDLFKVHSMTETQVKDKCLKHQNGPKDLYCKDCREPICEWCCKLKENPHFEHNYESIVSYAEKLREGLKDIPLTFPTFEEFAANFDQIGVKFKEQFEGGFNTTLGQIDEMIKILTNLRQDYANTVKKKLERGVLLMKILKMLYLGFYSDLKKSVNSLDVTMLKYLNEISYELIDMKFIYNNVIRDEILKFKSQFEAMGNLVGQSVEIEYNFKKVSRDYKSIQTISAHKSLVTALYPLKDGRVISGSGDHTIKIWEEMNGMFNCSGTIDEFTGYVIALLQLSDGQIASASRDNTIRIWTETEKGYVCKQTLTEHNDCATSLIQLKDGRIASGSKDKTIRIWGDIQNGFQCLQVLNEHMEGVYTVIDLFDNRLASGSDDNTIRIWEETEGLFKCTHILNGHSKRVRCLLQLRDGRMASGSDDNTIRIWTEIENIFICSVVINGHSNGINCLIQLLDGRIASAAKDKTIRIWIESQNTFLSSEILKGHKATIYALIQLKDGRLCSGSSDKAMKIWRNRDGFL